jgi:hypothetical protein
MLMALISLFTIVKDYFFIEINIPGKQQTWVVNMKDLQPGVYLIKVEIVGRLFESKKITKL